MSKGLHTNGENCWYCPGDTTAGGNGTFFPACDKIIDSVTGFDKVGRIILSKFSFPSADAIINKKNNTISRQFLREYISFLEIIVLYEELLIVNQPFTVTLEDYNDRSSPIYSDFDYLDFAGDAQLNDGISKLRSTESWIQEVIFDINGLAADPTIFAAKTIEVMAGGAENLGHPPHAEDLYQTVFSHGQAMAAFEVARSLNLPFFGPKVEYHPLVLKQEEEAKIVERNITSRFKERLDSGAKEILEQISRYSDQYNFDVSPISALILERAYEPKDMLFVALDLRDEYRSFRRRNQELEEILFDQNASKQKKLAAIDEIDRVLTNLWGKHEGGFARHLKTTGGIIDQALDYSKDGLTLKNLIQFVSSAPMEYIVEQVRRRNYRVLFDAKDSFLRQASVESKVAQLFSSILPKGSELSFQEVSCTHFWEWSYPHELVSSRIKEYFVSDDDIPF